MFILAIAFGVCAGRFIGQYQDLQRTKARLAEANAQMAMTKPGSYLEWLSATSTDPLAGLTDEEYAQATTPV